MRRAAAQDELLAWCEQHPSAALAALPFEISEMAGAVGFIPALALMRAFGGQEIWIATAHNSQGKRWREIAQLVGEEAAQWLCHKYGHSMFMVPVGASVVSACQHSKIAAMLDNGVSHRKIAIALGIHVRTVERVNREIKRRAAKLPARIKVAANA